MNTDQHPTRRMLLAGGLAASLNAQWPQRKLRLALIGFDGHVGEITNALARLPQVELVAAADAASDPGAAAAFWKSPAAARVTRYSTASELLTHESLDLAAVCNNDGDRAPVVISCLRRGLHVIAEKPLAITRSSLDAVYNARRESGRQLGMLLPMRFDPPYLAMREIVARGTIGEVLQIDGQKSYQLGSRPEWQKHAATYGSTLLWIGIHTIDLMTWTSGRAFTEVASFQAPGLIPGYGDMELVTASIFRLDNGGTATLRMDYLRPAAAPGHGDDRLRLAGTRGVLEYQAATGVTLAAAGAPPRTITALPPAGSVFQDFVRHVWLHEATHLPWAEIVRANEYTLAAHLAAQSHSLRPIAAPAV